jgi:hypothetical protein
MVIEETDFVPLPSSPFRRRGLWRRLHPQTFALLFALTIVILIVQFYPRSGDLSGDENTGMIVMEHGFPFIFNAVGVESFKLDFNALLANMLIMGATITWSMVWMERCSRRGEGMRTWHSIHSSTWIMIGFLVLLGLFVERYSFVQHETMTNYSDEVQGVPFVYHQVRDITDNPPPLITFDPIILVFDILLIGAAIAEVAYWFERLQPRPRVLVIEKK